MREGWKYKKLKDVASLITDGDWIESRHQSESGIRLIQTGNVGNGIFKAKDDKPHYISEDTFLELGCTEIFRGDCLVSRLPEPVGRACIIPEVGCRMITAVDCTIIRFKDCVLPKLFVYYTRSKQYKREIDNSTTGTTRKRISRKNLESVSIPLLPVDEQNKIVAELDLLTEIIDKQKQQLKELDTLAQSIFYDMFGSPDANEKEWIMKSLAEIGTIVSGSTPSTSDESNWDGDVNWVTPAELGVQLFYGETRRKITSKAAKSLTIMPIGTLLMSSRAPIGKLAITSVPMCCNQGFKNIVCGNNVNNIYLYYCLMLNINSIKAMGRGATFKEVSKQAVSSFEIMLPPMNLQELFAQKILSIESQKKSINRSIAESQKLFDYTMDKYFG